MIERDPGGQLEGLAQSPGGQAGPGQHKWGGADILSEAGGKPGEWVGRQISLQLRQRGS